MGQEKFLRCDNGPQFLGSFIEFCAENYITIERASPYNPTSNASAEQNLGILKKLLKKSARGGEDFLQQFYVMQNLPHTSEGLSPAQLFFQREVRSPMFYTPPCHKDEMGAGLQRHYDRERQREVRNERMRQKTSFCDRIIYYWTHKEPSTRHSKKKANFRFSSRHHHNFTS